MGILKTFKRLRKRNAREEAAVPSFQVKYESFKELLNSNIELLNIIAKIEEKLQGNQIFGMSFVKSQSVLAIFHALRMIQRFSDLSGGQHPLLLNAFDAIHSEIKEALQKRTDAPFYGYVLPLTRVTKEMADCVGDKGANLGEALNQLKLPVPPGFAVTVDAYHAMLNHKGLGEEIEKRKMEWDPNDLEGVKALSEEIQGLILSAEVPPELEEAILSAYDDLSVQGARDETFRNVSVRSSALGEDSDLSFAGQYRSMLNVARDGLIHAYKSILASLYGPQAVVYRRNKGIRDEDVAMSVCCLQMVESSASGVVYSTHPAQAEDVIVVTAVRGLGPLAVNGTLTPDAYTLAKDGSAAVLHEKISRKRIRLDADCDGGLTEAPLAEALQREPCLSPGQLKTLADFATRLEEHYGQPQDIEWALDPEGRLFILQTRPLRLTDRSSKRQVAPAVIGHRLLTAEGDVAFPGVGSGPAFHVRSEADLTHFPEGAVLVARHSAPQFVAVMPRAQAIVTDFGSATGHMASLAREFGVPSILGVETATEKIPDGTIVTVDAYSGRVYEGEASELLELRRKKAPPMKGTPVYETLRRVADRIVPLHLLDPKAANFSPQSCETLHDIMRFIHERSYSYMFQISDAVSDRGGNALKLMSAVPLDLYVIDLGGGLRPLKRGAKSVTEEDILSAPFLALLGGLTHPEVQDPAPRPIHFNGFMSVMREQLLSPPQAAERFGDRSYAVVSDKYINFSSRVGYHYSVLDAYCGQSVNKNYITFSFKGGAADDVRRNRRVRAIAEILAGLDFNVEVAGDRVDARLQKHDGGLIEARLDAVGRLLQFTRQMDMLMGSEEAVEAVVKCFLEGDYKMCRTSIPASGKGKPARRRNRSESEERSR